MLHAQDSFAERTVRLRIAWGGEKPNAWSGHIRLSGGTFSDLQLIGLEADAPGSVWLEDNAIRVDSIRPRRFDGIDVTATAGSAARLSLEMRTDPKLPASAESMMLAELESGAVRHAMDEAGNAIVVQQLAVEGLRLRSDRDSLIFAPGEEFSLDVHAALPDVTPGTRLDIVTKLSPARGQDTLWSNEQRIPVPVEGAPSCHVKIPLRFEEGVYTVRISVGQPTGFGERFLPGTKHERLAQRTFQVVVLRLAAESLAAQPRWETVLEIDPANPRWWQRLPAWTQLQRIPGFVPRPLGSLRAGAVEHPFGPFVELPPTTTGEEPHWQAYPLPIERTGLPHRLEVDYPADGEQHLGISILEANSTGRVVPIGRDSGVYVEGFGRIEQHEPHTHRYIFWPRTNSPMLLVTNQHPTAAALFGQIRVSRTDGKIGGAKRNVRWQDSERLVAAYFAKPLLPEQFGATEGVSSTSGQSVDDWQTFYEAARRLSEYLPHAGYNAAVVNVLADGSSIYPTNELNPTPLYQTGRMAAAANDLPEADPLELMLRVFDREGLALVPSLQLAAPLPQLERLRRAADAQTSGLEWVGADGRTWLETHGSPQGLAPYYNLLNEQVQLALLQVVRELVERYGHHDALAGLAIQLSSQGYALLPGMEWGYDDATIEQFQRDTGIPILTNGANRFAVRRTALTGEHAAAWRAWRSSRVLHFYERLAEMVRSSGPNRRLLLTIEELLAWPGIREEARPNILNRLQLDRVISDAGIDAKRLKEIDGVALCPAQFVVPTSPLVDRAIDSELNEAVTAVQRTGTEVQPRAVMFFHRPQRVRMASFDAKNGLNSHTLLVTHAAADASLVRRRFARALAQSDPQIILDGGELLAMGQEEATRDILCAIQQLPTSPSTVQREQPLTVRIYSGAETTTCLVINEGPWRVDAAIALDVAHETVMEKLVGESAAMAGSAPSRSFAAGRHPWTLQLEPYGIEVVRFMSTKIQVGEIKATLGAAALAELETMVADLENRDLTALSRYEVLTNPGFEPQGGGTALPGWHVVEGSNDVTAELDATTPRSGRTSLYFQCRGPRGAIASDPFPTPPTGQIYFVAWARGENLGPQSELRLVLETEGQTTPYRRFATVGGVASGSLPLQAEWQRRPYGFYLNDIPLDSRGTMRVRLELTGPGEVWLDDVQLYDLLFPMGKDWYTFSDQEKLALVKLRSEVRRALDSGRYSDCVELLEGYWPRFLLAYTQPIPPLAPAMVKEDPRPIPKAEANRETSEVGDNKAPATTGWRKFVPFLR